MDDAGVFDRAMRLLRAVLRREHWWAEFWSGLVAIVWGIADHFTESGIADNARYSLLTRLAPQDAWDLAAISVGVAQLWCLLADTSRARAAAAFLAAVFFGFLTYGLALFDPRATPPGVVSYAGFLGINMFALALAWRRAS